MYKFLILKVFCLSICLITKAQKVYFNTSNTLYEMTGGPGTCTNITAFASCPGAAFFSLALFKDTLYYNVNGGGLYRIKTDGTGCQMISTGFNGNSLTVSNSGIIYTVSTARQLLSFNPYTNQLTNHGIIPWFSSGDLIFYESKLLLAGSVAATGPGIFELNIQNPPASVPFMLTPGRNFFGLLAYPTSCGNTKYYALEPQALTTNLVELDMINKTVVGNVCNINLPVYDAASSAEVGITSNNINFSSIQFTNPCAPNNTTNITAVSNSNNNTLLYSINSGPTNNNGIFNNVAVGTHTIRVSTADGLCFKDSVIQVTQLQQPQFSIQIQPENCNQSNGSITIIPINNSNYTFSINNGTASTNSTFSSLNTNNYLISIYNGSCKKDTLVFVPALSPNINFSVVTKPDTCNLSKGGFNIIGAANNTTFAINNGTPITSTGFQNLNANSYLLSAFLNNCRKDTTITITNTNVTPTFNLILAGDTCNKNTGSITVLNAPPQATYAFNSGTFTNSNYIANLSSGTYTLNIQNGSCRKDSVINIVNYTIPINFSAVLNNANCKNQNGSITLQPFNNVNSFTYALQNGTITNNNTFSNLSAGTYNVTLFSQGCKKDSVVTLSMNPALNITKNISITNPTCIIPNSGVLNIQINGSETPYTSYLNSQSLTGQLISFQNLLPNNYTLKIFNNLGCIVDSSTHTLSILANQICNQIYIPTAFTPNNDGNNDLYKPFIGVHNSKISFKIFNRLGQIVYSNNTHNPSWDGKFKSKLQPTGTYIYQLLYNDVANNSKVLKGTLQIIY
jgi:gliding motility-associated-like protein